MTISVNKLKVILSFSYMNVCADEFSSSVSTDKMYSDLGPDKLLKLRNINITKILDSILGMSAESELAPECLFELDSFYKEITDNQQIAEFLSRALMIEFNQKLGVYAKKGNEVGEVVWKSGHYNKSHLNLDYQASKSLEISEHDMRPTHGRGSMLGDDDPFLMKKVLEKGQMKNKDWVISRNLLAGNFASIIF